MDQCSAIREVTKLQAEDPSSSAKCPGVLGSLRSRCWGENTALGGWLATEIHESLIWGLWFFSPKWELVRHLRISDTAVHARPTHCLFSGLTGHSKLNSQTNAEKQNEGEQNWILLLFPKINFFMRIWKSDYRRGSIFFCYILILL